MICHTVNEPQPSAVQYQGLLRKITPLQPDLTGIDSSAGAKLQQVPLDSHGSLAVL